MDKKILESLIEINSNLSVIIFLLGFIILLLIGVVIF